MTSVQELYGELWAGEKDLDQELAQSFDPRGTESLFAMFAALGPRAGQLVVDVGARDATHTIRLVRDHGLRAVALDPVPLHVELAKRGVVDGGRATVGDRPARDGRQHVVGDFPPFFARAAL